MRRPEPEQGMVIRYDYLWRDEANRGRVEGSKDRPCAIVVAIRRDGAESKALLAPITHSPPDDPEHAIEIPARVKSMLGLDDARSWIITSELNSVNWSDPGIVPVTRDRWSYGMLPATLVNALVARALHHQRRQPNIVERKP